MPTQMRLTAPAAIAGLLTLLVFTNPSAAPAQAAECLAAPNGAAPEGSHWYYRTDRVKRRKCWYVGSEDGTVRQTARRPAPQAQPPATQPPATSAPAASAPPQVMSAPPQVITPPPAPRMSGIADSPSAPPPQAEAPAPSPQNEATEVWPKMTTGDAAPAPGLSPQSIDPWQALDAAAREAAATSAPAAPEDSTTGANADVGDDAAEQTPEAAIESAVSITPGRMLILVLCALAVAGAIFYELRQLAERRRQAQLDRLHLDRRRADWSAATRENAPARSDGLRNPPPWATQRVDPRHDEEPTLRRIMRGEERRPMWTDEPAA